MSSPSLSMPKISGGALLTFLVVLAVMFFIVGNPEMYGLTNAAIGGIGAPNVVLTADGKLRMGGALIHAIVFALLVWLVLSL